MEVRFEAWTRPETGTFTRLFPLRDVIGWQLQLGLFGHGQITIPADSRIDEILYVDPQDHANDQASLIRAYVGDTHLYDFYAARVSIYVDDTGSRSAVITGGGPGTALERVRVRQFDYDENPSLTPDWVYGPVNTLLTNPGFEDGTPDEDFEDLDLGGWAELGGAAFDAGETDATWEELLWDISASPSSPITGAYSLQIPFPGTPPAGVRKIIDVQPDAQVRVRYNFEEPTGNGDRFLMFATDPDGGSIPTIHTANGWIYNGGAFVELDGAARGTGASDGTTQTFDIEVTCGAEQTRLAVGCQNATTSTGTDPGYLDDGVYTGDGIGTGPWFAHRNSYQMMELDSTTKRTGTYSLKFQTESMADDEARDGPSQYVFCEVGTQYDLSAWVYQASGLTHYFRVGMKRRGSGWTAGLADVAVPTATWTRVGCNGVADQEAYEFTVRWVNATGGASASPVFYVDDCSMGEGEEASTIGKIWGDLITDAATGHTPDRTALDWLTLTFDDTDDSSSTAWDDDISVVVARGQTMRRVFEFHTSTFGYEGDMRPDPADDTDIQLNLYNPDGMGTDYTATDGTAILKTGVVSVGPIVRREPEATYAMVEGNTQWFGESRTTALEAVWGEIETYQGSEEMEAASLDTLAATLTTGDVTETLALRLQDPPLIPGIDYLIGDTLNVTVGVIPTAAYRVVDIACSSGDDEPMWQLQLVPV